jgi:hypothetical protein
MLSDNPVWFFSLPTYIVLAYLGTLSGSAGGYFSLRQARCSFKVYLSRFQFNYITYGFGKAIILPFL